MYARTQQKCDCEPIQQTNECNAHTHVQTERQTQSQRHTYVHHDQNDIICHFSGFRCSPSLTGAVPFLNVGIETASVITVLRSTPSFTQNHSRIKYKRFCCCCSLALSLPVHELIFLSFRRRRRRHTIPALFLSFHSLF